jgi:hypothetical protein
LLQVSALTPRALNQAKYPIIFTPVPMGILIHTIKEIIILGNCFGSFHLSALRARLRVSLRFPLLLERKLAKKFSRSHRYIRSFPKHQASTHANKTKLVSFSVHVLLENQKSVLCSKK